MPVRKSKMDFMPIVKAAGGGVAATIIDEKINLGSIGANLPEGAISGAVGSALCLFLPQFKDVGLGMVGAGAKSATEEIMLKRELDAAATQGITRVASDLSEATQGVTRMSSDLTEAQEAIENDEF